MKHYIVPRARQADYNNMIKIHDWCSEVFGKEDYVRWNTDWTVGHTYFSLTNMKEAK